MTRLCPLSFVVFMFIVSVFFDEETIRLPGFLCSFLLYLLIGCHSAQYDPHWCDEPFT